MATRIFYGIKFCEQFLKRTCQVWSKLDQQLGRRRCLKEIVDDARQRTDTSPPLTLYQTKIECICRRQNKCEQSIENWVWKGRKHCGKGENAGYQQFLLFPQCFQKPSVSGSLKIGIVW